MEKDAEQAEDAGATRAVEQGDVCHENGAIEILTVAVW